MKTSGWDPNPKRKTRAYEIPVYVGMMMICNMCVREQVHPITFEAKRTQNWIIPEPGDAWFRFFEFRNLLVLR